MLDCSSAGWYPEPELFWLDGEGNIMSAGPPETTTDPDGVYSVSSRGMVEKRHNNHFTCRVQKRTSTRPERRTFMFQMISSWPSLTVLFLSVST
ncbi:hypothetical protein CHARACLAT_027830 [Characodon lateralis]|uniref:Ig-like domain-containing protein n=1 Tax=Characodon lateralis TaxID=208331 RepID=A0ABU7EDM0_9TELE|nr:hypothetical protein [Characodon lateralis]